MRWLPIWPRFGLDEGMSRLRVLAALACAMLTLGGLTACAATQAPPTPTRAQLETLISEQAGAGSNGFTTYGVSFVRFVTPNRWATTMNRCVEAAGISSVDFTQANTPYWMLNPPQGRAAFERALVACTLRYPETTVRPLLRTDAQWNYQYDYLATEFLACVRSSGARVEALETRAAFLRSAHAFAAMPSPYRLITRLPAGLPRKAIEEKCPALAPGL